MSIRIARLGAQRQYVDRQDVWLPIGRQTPAAARRQARAALTSWRLDGERLDDALLVVSELVANAVAYGAGRLLAPVRLTLTLTRTRRAETVVVAVRDNTPVGNALLLAMVAAGPPPPNQWAASGRGLAIVRALAARLDANAEPGRKTMIATLVFPSARYHAA